MIFTAVTSADQVTREILGAAESVHDGWYNDGPIEWDDFIDRLDGMDMPDGTILDLGNDLDSPAIRKIKKHIREYRKLG